MKNTLKLTGANLLNLSLAAAFLCAALGCSGFMKGFQEGYDKGRGATSNSSGTSSGSPANSSGGTTTGSNTKLAADIVGRWELSNSGKTVAFEFGDDGSLESFADGKTMTKGSYEVIDERTVKTRNDAGGVTETIPISVSGNKLTMTVSGTTLTFTRK